MIIPKGKKYSSFLEQVEELLAGVDVELLIEMLHVRGNMLGA